MRIQHNIAAVNSYRNFGVNNSKLSKNLEKLSSGYAVNRAGDDAAGLAVSEKMRAQISGLEAATKNAKDGIGLIQTTEGALTEVHDMLNRMYYLAEQAANGTYTAGDRKNLQAEVTSLQAEIKRIGTNADFNGVKVLAGKLKGKSLQIGETKAEALTLSSALLSALSGQIKSALSLKISGSGTSTAQNALATIKSAINKVSEIRGQLGAYQNRLEHTVNNLGVMKENITDAESRIRDTDMAEEMMKYTKNNIMNQAAQAMLASANQQPQQVLQLLQ